MVRSKPASLAGARGRLSFHPELNVLESHRGHALLSKSLPALGHQHWVYTSLGRSCAVRCLTPPTRTDRGVRRTFGGDSPEMNTLFNAPMRNPLRLPTDCAVTDFSCQPLAQPTTGQAIALRA